MFDLVYPAKATVDVDGRVLVVFPDVHGAATDGADMHEALSEAQDCLMEAIAAAMASGEDIPVPSKLKRGQVMVPLTPSIAVKAVLYTTIREQNRSNSWLARKLKINEKEARRMLDPFHSTKLPRMNEALQALGKDIIIGVRDRSI